MRTLGTSSVEVTAIGLGCWQFSENKSIAGKFWNAIDNETTNAIVRTALDGGINWFDTAEAYGNGRSEAGLSRALKAADRKNGEVVVATKWWPALRRAISIEKTIDDRLRHLDGFDIDLHQVHQPFISLSSHEAQMEAMVRLVEQKKIKTVGVSNFPAAQLRVCHAALARHGIPLVANQVKYSLLDRRIEKNGVLDTAKELKITIIAYSPLEQGLLTGKFHDDPSLLRARTGPRRFLPAFRSSGRAKSAPVLSALKEIAAQHGATPAQVALSWLITFHGETVVAIPGASKVRHAEESAKALQVELTGEELDRLDRASRSFM